MNFYESIAVLRAGFAQVISRLHLRVRNQRPSGRLIGRSGRNVIGIIIDIFIRNKGTASSRGFVVSLHRELHNRQGKLCTNEEMRTEKLMLCGWLEMGEWRTCRRQKCV
jgi:hypothetical protein